MKTMGQLFTVGLCAITLITTAAFAAHHEQAEANKKLVHEYWEAMNKGTLDFIEEYIAEDYVNHRSGGQEMRGREAVRDYMQMMWAAFPDAHHLVHDLIAEGDRVATRWTVEATHKGEFMGVPATEKRLKVTGFTIARIANGKIAEEWDMVDGLGLMQQLGVIPTEEMGEPMAHAAHQGAMAMPAEQSKTSMGEVEKNKQLVRGYWADFGQGVLGHIDEYFAEDYVDHQPDRELHGRDQLEAFVTKLLEAFPDGKVKLEDIFAEGNKVVTRWVMEGTHKGELMGVPATDKPVKIEGLTISRIANGKIVEEWEMADALGLMQQLGVVPAQ